MVEHPSTEQLHLSYDGELPQREAAVIAAHIAGCDQCRATLAELTRMGEFVRLAVAPVQAAIAPNIHPATSAEPDFARMFQAIESALQSADTANTVANTLTEHNEPRTQQGAVIHTLHGRGSRKSDAPAPMPTRTEPKNEAQDLPLARAAARMAPVQPLPSPKPPSKPKPTPSKAERLHHRLTRGAPALGAIALAAAALLIVYRQDQPALEIMDEAALEASVDGPSEVLDVDFGSNTGQVIAIPLSDGSSVPVVWIEDDDGENGEDDDEE